MLVPAKHHFPVELEPNDSSTFVVENDIPTKYLINPKIFIRNIGSEPIRVVLNHILDLGDGVNPLYSGAYTTNLLTSDVAAGSLLTVQIPSPCIISPPDIERHELVISSSVLNVATNIVHVIVSGVYDDAVSQHNPSYGVSIV